MGIRGMSMPQREEINPKGLRRAAIGGVTALVSAILTVSSAEPAAAAPPSARSYYVSNYDLNWAYDRGCDAGNADEADSGTQIHYVVLDFGSMYEDNGTWMVSAFSGAAFTQTKARNMVVEWAHGYYVCSGTDHTSTAYVGLGTNNSDGDVTTAAGAHMAVAAQNAIDNATSGGWYGQGRPIAANDFESWGQSSALNTKSRNWISGYNASTPTPIMVNYGDAGGCPSTSTPSAGSCNAGNNAETIWQVSWSGAAWPLPEIYNTSGTQAKQWRWLSRYAKSAHGAALKFKGVMAQSGACSQNGGGCSGTDNTPSEAWNQLDTQLNSDSITATTPGPPTNIWWGP